MRALRKRLKINKFKKSRTNFICVRFKRIRDHDTRSYFIEGNVLFNDALNTFYLRSLTSGVTESLLFFSGSKREGRPSSGGGQEDGIAMIYCAQSKVKWGSHGVNGGGAGGMSPQAPHSYATKSYLF